MLLDCDAPGQGCVEETNCPAFTDWGVAIHIANGNLQLSGQMICDGKVVAECQNAAGEHFKDCGIQDGNWGPGSCGGTIVSGTGEGMVECYDPPSERTITIILKGVEGILTDARVIKSDA